MEDPKREDGLVPIEGPQCQQDFTTQLFNLAALLRSNPVSVASIEGELDGHHVVILGTPADGLPLAESRKFRPLAVLMHSGAYNNVNVHDSGVWEGALLTVTRPHDDTVTTSRRDGKLEVTREPNTGDGLPALSRAGSRKLQEEN